MTTYGGRLRAARTARGWTQAELAELAGISQVELSRAEHGQRQLPLERRQQVAAALGLDIELHAPAAPRTVMARIGRQYCAVCKERER